MSLLSTRVWACLLRNTHVLQDGISRRKCDTRHNIGGVRADNITLSYPVTPGFGDLSMEISPAFAFHRMSITRKYLDGFTSLGEHQPPFLK